MLRVVRNSEDRFSHFLDRKQKTLLVHGKGSTWAFPPHHPLITVDYQVISRLSGNSGDYYMSLSSGFPTRSDTNQAVQPQKMTRA